MGNWSELQEDMLRLIATRLSLPVDRVGLSLVCKNWSEFAISEPKFLPCPPPWLMLAETPGTTVRQFAGITPEDGKDRIFELDFPGAQGTRLVGSFGLWVVTLNLNGEIRMHNPFTGEKPIDLPPLLCFEKYEEYLKCTCSHYVEGCEIKDIKVPLNDGFVPHKIVISSLEMGKEFVVMAIYEGTRKLAFYKPGAGSSCWTTMSHQRVCFHDVLFYCGNFYGVNGLGVVRRCHLDGPTLVQVSKELRLSFISKDVIRRHLVEWCGMLLQVMKIIKADFDSDDYPTVGFEIYRLDFDSNEWIRVNDLGEYCLFVGLNATVALLASGRSNLQPNSVYFTDDYLIGVVGAENGRHMGVYSLADGSIKPHYKGVSVSFIAPPIWVGLS